MVSYRYTLKEASLREVIVIYLCFDNPWSRYWISMVVFQVGSKFFYLPLPSDYGARGRIPTLL